MMCHRIATPILATIVALPSSVAEPPAVPEWSTAEAPLLREHVQLTQRSQFIRAGEAYFDHHSPPRWIIFQAVPAPKAGDQTPPQGFYSMYIARLKYDPADPARIVGIDEPIEVSTPGSANTCGWFFPEPYDSTILFATTIDPPSEDAQPGYQRGTGKYRWEFPREMRILRRAVLQLEPAPPPGKEGTMRCGNDFMPVEVAGDGAGYVAEGSVSPDGRFLVYTRMVNAAEKNLDIYVRDLMAQQPGEDRAIVTAPGYDGGPFFSPDGKRLCYRSDRERNDKLQVYVCDLKFDDGGVPSGMEREHQITKNDHVNWGPYWHPSGGVLVYATSELGHTNYEVFAAEVPGRGETRGPADLRRRRVTHAAGADVLPAFSDDGRYIMWTSKRGPAEGGEPSSQVWVAGVARGAFEDAVKFFEGAQVPSDKR